MSNKPNILLIVADQQRYDCLGAYGNREIRTPHIDGLAADGVLYENSFCPHPVCTPSRYSMLSGQYVHQHLGLSNRSTLPAGTPTLPRMLKEAGYSTAAVGKMHFTPTYLDVGFEQMTLAEQNGAGRYEDDYHEWLREKGLYDRNDLMDQEAEFRARAPEVYWETYGALTSNLAEEHHSTTWIGGEALKKLESWEGDGNFLMASFIKPHHPFDPPEPWDRMYDPEGLSLLPGWTESLIHGDDGRGYFSFEELTEAQLRRVMAYYYATISQIDHHVGHMLAYLRAHDLYDNTVVVYTSDHGEFLGYHHRILKGYRMLEPLVRVPLVIKYAGQRGIAARDDRLVNNIDLAPTLLAAAGVESAETMCGSNLLDSGAGNTYIFAEGRHEYMIRSRTRKLLRHRNREQSMFFDLTNDPLEFENLYGRDECRSEIALYQDELADWMLFGSQPRRHLDLNASQCSTDQTQRPTESLYAYFRERMG